MNEGRQISRFAQPAQPKQMEEGFAFLLEKLSTGSSKRDLNQVTAPYSKESNFQKFSSTDSDKWPNVLVKERIDQEIMRRVLDHGHIGGNAISASACGCSLTDIPWRRCSIKKSTPTAIDILGPGYYHTEKFYEGKHTSEAVSTMKYIEDNKVSQNMKWERKMKDQIRIHDIPGKTSKYRQRMCHENSGESTPCSDENRKLPMKISSSSRFSAPAYRAESYSKTTGMSLTLDYDSKFDKRIPISVTGHCERESSNVKLTKPQYEYNSAIPLTVDCGPQASFQTIVLQSPIKFSTVFKSKVEAGCTYPTSSTGTLLGPGVFPGANISSIAITNPGHFSSAFLASKPSVPVKIANVDSSSKLPKFTDVNDKGFIFGCEDLSGKKPGHLAAWTKKKIKKIYPKLRNYSH